MYIYKKKKKKSWQSVWKNTSVEMPSGNFFAKNDMPYQQLTVGVIFWAMFLLLGLSYINCTH